MACYRDDLRIGYGLENYGEGLHMITDGGPGQGRCLSFKRARHGDDELLVALMFYKKESRQVPDQVLDTARQRMERAK